MTSGLAENTALPVTGQHCKKQPRRDPVAIPFNPVRINIRILFFTLVAVDYLVDADRLSGWVEIFKAPQGTAQAGAQGLIAAIRALFATFGVDFLNRWEVRHRMSSTYFTQSNGRADLAVKKAKRMLMDNADPTGSLNNDGLLHATRRTPIAI